jgi:TolA-binding protein
MMLADNSVLKTGADGACELNIDDETVNIGSSRYVRIKDILEKLGQKKKISWIKKVSKYTKTLAKSDKSHARTALAGVRGERTDSGEIEWFEDMEEDEYNTLEKLFQEGRVHFENGDYSLAIPIFYEIIENEEGEPFKNEVSFYLGISLFNNLQYGEALPFLEKSTSNKGFYYYEPAVFHHAFTEYFLRNYEGAIDGFKLYDKDFPNGELRSYALYMLGKCYSDVGNKDQSRKYYTEVLNLYPNTEIYEEASSELAGL